MASGVTDKGKAWILETTFRKQMNGTTISDRMYVALIKATTTPTADLEEWGDLSGAEIADGNGYSQTNKKPIDRGTTDFNVISSDADAETNNYGHVQLENVEWTAVTGALPSSGDGARYAILMDNKGGSANDATNQVLAWWDLGSDRSVAVGQTLSLQDMEIRLS